MSVSSVSFSYRLSQEHNAQTLLWDSCRAVAGAVRLLSAVGRRLFAVLSHFLPHLLIALALTALVAVVVVAVAMVPVTFWAGLLVVGAFGWATYPRSKGK